MSNKIFTVHVISPEKILYTGEADYVKIPGVQGSFGVMFNHANLVSELEIGVLEVKNGNNKTFMVIDGGFVEVKNNVVNVLANSGDNKESLNKEKLEKELNSIDSKSSNYDQIKKIKVRLTMLGN
jgi:F-type H+-transporting ATPase subunit epsilon